MSVNSVKSIVLLKMPDVPNDTRLDDFTSLAKFYVSEKIFKEKYNYATALVVCHQLTMEMQSGGDATTSGIGSVGGISSKKEGQLSIGYGGVGSNVSQNKQYFMSTPFGQEFLQLRGSCLLMPRNRFVSGS